MTDRTRRRLATFIAPFRVQPGAKVKLARDFDPAFKAGIKKKQQGVELLQEGVELLSEYQARLAAQDTHGVLVVLQALDAAGKDGTIRHVMSGVNPQGVTVHSFKVPSAEELNHDFLWRYQQRLPGRGEIGIFNRSHYEEVLVVRVHPENLDRERMPPEAKGKGVWERRYREINDWEKYLVDNGLHIVKLFLNLSKEEQRIRFLRRLDLPDHNWKFSANDVRERELLGRLPGGVLGDALAHQHPVGAVVRDSGRPQVVRAPGRQLRAGPRADGAEPSVPDRGRRGASAAGPGQGEARGGAPAGAAPDPVANQLKRDSAATAAGSCVRPSARRRSRRGVLACRSCHCANTGPGARTAGS